MSRWKAYLIEPDAVLLEKIDKLINGLKVERKRLIRRTVRRMERAAEKARKEANDHQQ